LGENSGHLPTLPQEILTVLLKIAEPVRNTRKAPKEQVDEVILGLCKKMPLSLNQLSQILKRNSDSLRKYYLNRLADEGKLEREHPNLRNHPRQRYRTCGQSK
jgi:predicted ArsR family transcriptional regulator